MHVSDFLLLALTGLLVATVPLSLAWSATGTHRLRKLAWTLAFVTFDLIVFGAFTRLTDSGLGCPDWPGCYGEANPFLAHRHIAAAEALLPTGPVTWMKAWIEMVHRFLAMGIGFLIIALLVGCVLRWRRTRERAYAPGLPALLLFWVLVQGAFGAFTVTMKLQPVIVTMHLLLGMTMLALAVWLGERLNGDMPTHAPMPVAAGDAAALRGLRPLAWLSAAVLLVQLALGGWVSTNYATLACTDFPLCQGRLVPDMDFGHGFTLWRALGKDAAGNYLPFAALTAIHWVHRNFAAVVVLVLGWTAWRARRVAGLRKTARNIALVLVAQAMTGMATVFFSFPLVVAVLHNAGAALLVLLVAMLNYQIQHPIHRTRPSSEAPSRTGAAASASHP